MNEKKVNIIQAILMSAFMAFMLSGFFSFSAHGVTMLWLHAWLKGFLMAWPIALILVVTFGRLIRQLAEYIALKL